MKVPLFITLNKEDDNFCGECMFKSTDFLNNVGTCLLFNKTLNPRIRYGSVEYWYTCDECDTAVRQSFHEFIEP